MEVHIGVLRDILIYSEDLEDHLKHLELALEIRRKNELYANKKKKNAALREKI